MWQGYIKKFIGYCVLLALAPCSVLAAGSQEGFTEGVDYFRLPNEVRNNPEVAKLLLADPDKVQVLFFFSYGCHGCEIFHTPFGKWEATAQRKYKDKLVIYSYPVSFNPQWKMLAKLYYTTQILDRSGKMNEAIFAGVHKQGIKLWQESVMQDFFVQHGYKASAFEKTFNSFGVNRQTKRADEIATTYKITMTPEIIVNGPHASYRLDFTKVDNDSPRLFKTLSYLVARETKLLN